ncbi:response regulator [Paenibacillus sp. XY044]|uniref:response regulator transcription factor n=1 Tax=Paenibacillus sp. XY044 TaxID=2026089 RepID=UPI000B97DACA|nr:response regulator [Paenibacillus sp. XY044]OZB94311.1 hypothetical protein CJP46_19095 [Paenibacillus sp. XY044]
MNKVMVVDDEILARNHLLELIDWEQQGFRICGIFDSGISAMDEMGRLHPDIIISDVYMPIMDGIQFSRQAQAEYPGAQFIMLSSYDRYDYVRDSFKGGAVDYLLKDRMNAEMLLSALNKARLAAAQNRIHSTDHASPEAALSTDMDREAVKKEIRSWFRGARLHSEAWVQLQSSLKAQYGGKALVVIALQVDHGTIGEQGLSEEEYHQWAKSVSMLFEQHFTGEMLYIRQHQFAVLYDTASSRSELKLNEEIEHYLGRISKLFSKFLNARIRYSFSAPCLRLDQLPHAYAAAVASLVEGRRSPEKSPEWGDISGTETGEYLLGIRQEMAILASVESRDIPSLERQINELYRIARDGSGAVSVRISRLNDQLCELAARLGRQFGPRAEELAKQLRAAMLSGSEEKWGECETAVVDCMLRMLELIEPEAVPEGESLYVRKAMNYIRTHFRGEISLGHAAAIVGIHPVYLSRLFRQETGIPFVEHVNRARVEAAKKMIENKIKIKDIYSEVGFQNYNYFFKVFKSVTGFTPANYERIVLHNKAN